MRLDPLRNYLGARDSLARGNLDEAIQKLEAALGQPAKPVLRDNLAKFMDYGKPAGSLLLDIIRVEMQKR